MSRTHSSRVHDAYDSAEDDSESDIDIDLQELGPTGDSLGGRVNGYGNRRIPMRDLGRGKYGRDTDSDERKRALSRRQTQDGESDGLLEERTGRRDPEDGASVDEPLLDGKSNITNGHARDSYGNPGGTARRTFWERLMSQNVKTPRSDLSQTQGNSRRIDIGQYPPPKFPPNAVSNAKYTAWSFLPRTLYNEFSFFFNMYFLLVALSQTIPQLRIGYLSTYVAPLAFVLIITLGKEAADDLARRKRDAEANKEEYTVLRLRDRTEKQRRRRGDMKSSHRKKRSRSQIEIPENNRLEDIIEEEDSIDAKLRGFMNIELDEITTRSRDLKVGDIIKLSKDQRVPADLVILKTTTNDTSVVESPKIGLEATKSHDGPSEQKSPEVAGGGEAFIRTDQLDGETDWKLRIASPLTQQLDFRGFAGLRIMAGKPEKKVNDFVGAIECHRSTIFDDQEQDQAPETAPLNIDNTAWANTVLASNVTIFAVVVYTGAQTRQAMSTSPSRSKTGLLEYEINNLTKILCALTLALSITLVALEGFNKREDQKWYVAITRFLILFSTIIPISLRVNLDMGKTVYAKFIERDNGMPNTIVRTSTIPEELGRIEYLLSDKTGTLTQNEMELKKIHVGTVSYAGEAMEEVSTYVRQGFSDTGANQSLFTPFTSVIPTSAAGSTTRTRREIGSRVRDLILALAICHNVTPTTEESDGESFTSYQASSPDEIAIVKFTGSAGLKLLHRDRKTITLQSTHSGQVVVKVKILDIFPFTSESKRMGIILQSLPIVSSVPSVSSSDSAGEIWFYQKGADTVMTSIVSANDWLDEETANMAREGLRTLVIGRKRLSSEQYLNFSNAYKSASLSINNRDAAMSRVTSTFLENNLELLGVTGVEDKLQHAVKPSLELLRNAGIRIWMLTGDKVETARCVAISSKLVARNQYIHTITNLNPSTTSPTHGLDLLNQFPSKASSTALLIDGTSLSYYLTHHPLPFISLAVTLPAVIACRCSPTQKADIALLIRSHTGKRVACIGDGGNDVSMIQAADVGLGIVGKEGRQASLAADFSIEQFHHLTKLLVWHGRNSYKRSAKLAQFVMHRGLVISVAQTVYSVATRFEPHALYRDWLLVGYATVYTMFPVFSLVLDRDVDEALANLYPELYKELTLGKTLNYRTFFTWLAISTYQGIIIQGLSQILVGALDPSTPPPHADSPEEAALDPAKSLYTLRMVAVSFTCLVINELVMVAAEIVTWHWVMIASLIGTALIYAGSIPFLGGYFDLEYVGSWGFAWRVAAIVGIAIVPVWSIKVLRRTLRPPSYRKVRGL